jgi:hypothetical protein
MTLDKKLNTAFPPKFVNAYIKQQLKDFGILSGYEQMDPIFPVSPTNLDDVFKNYVGAPGEQNPLLIQYDRMIRLRPNAFYRHKREQVIYTLYCTEMTKIYDATRIIFEALDREDAAAQDINAYTRKTFGGSNTDPLNVYFHNLKVYQVDQTRDLIELGSVRTTYANKLIIEYDYHTKDLDTPSRYT